MSATLRSPRRLAMLTCLCFCWTCFGLGSNPELVQWYEQASAYYSAVMTGSETKPSRGEWQEFLDQLNWASLQLGVSSSWDPAGRTIHRSPRVRLSFPGVGGTHDIWSNDVTLVVASVSAKITSEVTMDTRLQPPESVLKIVVTDPATGARAIYIIHDYKDASIDVQTPKTGQVTGLTPFLKTSLFVYRKPGLPPGLVVRGKTPTPTRRAPGPG